MIVLALDTCLAACSVALVDDGRPLAAGSQAMARGHQERLAPLVKELMGEAGVDFAAIGMIAVTVGPGSFTGLRVGLAFAKGLALALRRPCVGVGTLEAVAASAPHKGFCAAVIDAGRGWVYIQAFAGTRPLAAPQILPLEQARAHILGLSGDGECLLAGPGAGLFEATIPRARSAGVAAPSPETVARLALSAAALPPSPLYLRAPDARPKSR
jgi:tRNA threonylcarbamoyladenosine biosynthesis protein TsaB